PVPQVREEAAGLLEQAERDALLATLEAHHWHVSRTAAQLGISRNTLYRKLQRHGIRRETD
ncbi:helix-turn-helix domain-containing protein, partial [Azotobacter beijerinckii]